MSTPAKSSQTTFVKVAECLYRNDSSGSYYALVKNNGKQIRRSLKTKDRKLAERRLNQFREDVSRLGKNQILIPSKDQFATIIRTMRQMHCRYWNAAIYGLRSLDF